MARIRTAASFDRLSAILGYLYDPKVGILGSIQENDREAGSPEFFRYMALAADTRALSGFENFSVGGGGSTSRDLALAKAIGEAIERYVAAIYDRRDHPIYTYRSAPFQCVPPADFALYDDQQLTQPDFPYRPFTEDSDVRWMPARSLVSGKSIHVPACFVHLPYLFSPDGDEWPLAQSISTGLACHDSFERAAAAGICEVIERDCFSITWQAMLSRSRIRLESLADHQKDVIRRFTSVRYSIHVMDISHDNEVPTILTVLRGRRDSEAAPLAVAAATDLSPDVAVTKSLEELAHTERYVRQLMVELKRIGEECDHKNVYSQVSHVNFWTSPERAERAAFLCSSATEIDFRELPDRATGDPARDLETLVDRVAATGHDVLVADLTTEDVAALGFHVIRALIPGYHPLFMGYASRALGGIRLWELPQKLGYPGLTREHGDNPMPHPFP
ncbi:YcaO-like family protein [Bradyrhizobium sp. Leo170]|uniref:YcaO-like family protein n=1 Tax=Bradyrhizobium sp. Leo170 TaxID=1571199 RepID=UPI00102EB628|nr:YcaO-like family protein [Bradyrhizobium sp. Leo170]TAI61214.1 hypothetical protein CWO89_36385 [Bradyrhizobium sp. Leo170]